MGQHQTSTDLIDDDLAAPDMPTHIGARLQCFAGYADDPAGGDGQILPVIIHKLSLRRVTTQSVPDLRVGSIVRLRIPMLGWRHLEICWIARGLAGCRFLLPLLPYELHAALNRARGGRDTPPPSRRGPSPFAAACGTAGAQRGAPRQTSRQHAFPIHTNVAAAGQTLIDALRRLCTGSFVAGHAPAFG